MSTSPTDRAQELAAESKFLTLCRIGFFGRGVLYIMIAWFALQTGRTEDLTGALEYLGRGNGRYLLMVIAAGLAAYGVWRLADAAFAIENPGRDGKALRKRAAAGCIGLIYLYLVVQGGASAACGQRRRYERAAAGRHRARPARRHRWCLARLR